MKGSPEMFDACLSEVLRIVSDSVSAQFSVVNRHEPVTFLLITPVQVMSTQDWRKIVCRF